MQDFQRTGTRIIAILFVVLMTACHRNHAAPLPPAPETPDTPLPAPENLSLKATGPHQVTLDWNITSTEQKQFAILRSDNGGDYSQIDVVDGKATQYVDDSVSTDVIYTYQIYAEDLTRKSDSVYSDQYQHPYFDACTSPLSPHDSNVVTFYDLPVSGLTYTTDTTYSVSDNTGVFDWDKTSDIHFSIGYIDIGTLHPGDKSGIHPIAKNSGGRTETTRNNLLRLFIALDVDADTTNGIQLPCELSLAYGNINPTVDYDSFAKQETVYRLTGGTALPSAQEAEALYNKYLFHDYVGHYELKWKVYIGGILPFQSKIYFDIDEYGNIDVPNALITYKNIDPHNNYRLRITDSTEILLAEFGYYKLEVNANILSDQTIKGGVVLESYTGGDLDGDAWGGRI